jgi:RNA polymerase sigma-70 factor (ECF subfamily)
MDNLPPAQQKVLELAYFEGLTHQELAERTGESLGTVKTRIRLGIAKLREALLNQGKVFRL